MKSLYHLLFLCLFSTSIFSQSIQGIVLNDDRETLADAYVWQAGSNNHTHTNLVGYFKMSDVESGDTLMVSYLGYETGLYILSESDLNSKFEIRLSSQSVKLDQVFVDNSVTSLSQVSRVDLQVNPVASSQEILRKVPGLFIGQHAGGGKAEQIFLRGFDIDHGTDIAIIVDGLPVNMVSHAHGQGYADLHFLIPETIGEIDFAKGPYYASKGNFATAGYVEFKTVDKLEKSSIGLEVGQFDTYRTSGLFNILDNSKSSAYIASEYIMSDGPFESPQNFNRINLMGKYVMRYNENDVFSLTASRFQSKWDASGQIPGRAVESGMISRFGAIDDTEGGQTSRTNVLMENTREISSTSFLKTKAFYSNYDFELFSNFTFFLEDNINGDQIQQYENRNIYGISSEYHHGYDLKVGYLNWICGANLRYDDVNNVQLSHTRNRKEVLDRYALGQVDETNFGMFTNLEYEIGNWMINPGLRFDLMKFDYQNDLSQNYTSLSNTETIISPKLNIIYNPNRSWQFFLKTGKGFHSNDTRVVIESGADEILPAAYGADLGSVWKPLPNLWLSVTAWYLYLEQEFVYVGDAGIVEPSGETERKGLDLGLRAEIIKGLYFDSDLTYTEARAIDAESGADHIPLAPIWTAAGGLSYKMNGLSASVRYRYLADRPANEDYSLTAHGYFVMDANVSYLFENGLELGIKAENILDEEWNEAQFATESRLSNEQDPVEEIHFTPGTPFFIKGMVRYNF